MKALHSTLISITLCAIVTSTQGQTTATEATTPPTTIDLQTIPCQGNWSEWSLCFPGSTSDSSSWQDRIYQLSPAQYEAEGLCQTPYLQNSVETRPCTTTKLPIDDSSTISCGSHYKCGNNRCISRTLLCNGDDDCGDNSDEYPSDIANCSVADSQYVCGFQQTQTTSNSPPKGERYLTGIPGIDQFAGGFDILTGTFRSNVLSMAGHGSCRRVLISGSTDTYYRIPANAASFRQMFEVAVGNTKIFESGAGIINATKADLKYNLNFGGQVIDVAGRTGFSQNTYLKNLISDSIANDQSRAYVSVTTNVNTAQVTLQEPSSLQTSTTFISRVMKLPYSDFSYEKYLSLIEDFGTHYVSAAKLGGTYTDTQIYSRCWLEGVDYLAYSPSAWRSVVSDCARESFFYRMDPTATTLSSNCQKTEGGETKTLRDEIQDTAIQIAGGSVDTSSNLKFSFGKDTWEAWVQSLVNGPVLNMKDFKLEKLSSLLQSPAIPFDSPERRENVTAFLERAVNLYLDPYDAENVCEKCTPISSGDITYNDQGTSITMFYYGVPYVAGTGANYKCRCAYDSPTNDQTCGAPQNLATFLTLLLCCVMAYWNAFAEI